MSIHDSESSTSERRRRLFRRNGPPRIHGRHRRRLPPISVLPTLCTLGNLVAGFAAIHFASRDFNSSLMFGWKPLTVAGALIFLGMFLDAIDGTLARLTRSTSELGGQLDSLADVVTFGVAPAFMTLRLVQHYLTGEGWVIGPDADVVWGKIIWGAAAVYVCCGALRLARFNVEMGPGTVNDHSLFRGLPSPGAAGTVTSLIIFHQNLLVNWAESNWLPKWSTLGIPAVMLVCAFGMVSSIPYIHFANRYFRKRESFAYVVRIVVILAMLLWWWQLTLALGFVIYAVSGPMRLLWHRIRPRAAPATPHS